VISRQLIPAEVKKGRRLDADEAVQSLIYAYHENHQRPPPMRHGCYVCGGNHRLYSAVVVCPH